MAEKEGENAKSYGKRRKWIWISFFVILGFIVIVFLLVRANITGRAVMIDSSSINTDGDRYVDSQDPEPALLNSAKLDLKVQATSWKWDDNNLVLAAVGKQAVRQDLPVAETFIAIHVNNTGNDYTEFVSFDIAFKIANQSIVTENVRLVALYPGESRQENYTHTIVSGDIQKISTQIVSGQKDKWEIEVTNLDYEYFPKG
jgi:hypothetical protein